MLLFALVGATVGYAQSIAESPTPISGLTSGFYVIKNVNSYKPLNYIYCANTINGALKHTATAPSADVTDPATIDKYLWYVDVKTTGENVKVTISSVTQAGYWPAATQNNKWLEVTNNPQVFDLKTTNQTLGGKTSAMTVDGNTCLIGNTYNSTDYSYFHVNNNNNIGAWNDANHESLLYAQFYAATGFANKVTLNYTDRKLNNTFTKVATFLASSTPTLEELTGLDFYTINSVKNESEATVNEITESGTYNVDCTSNFPFEVMTFTNDGAFANANFYTMQIVQGSRDVVYENGTRVTTVPNTKGFNKESLWAFEQVSGTEANFKIYNFAAGATAPMAVNGTGNKTSVDMGTYDSGDASTDQFTLTTSGTGYAFLHTKAITYLNASVTLVDTNNDGNQDANTGLGLWNENGTGSCFFFTSVDDMTAAATNFVGDPDPEYRTTEGFIHASSTGIQDAYYLWAYNNGKTLANLNTALESVSVSFDYKNPYGFDFNPSKVYQIISYNDVNHKGQVIYADPYKNSEGGVYDQGRNLLTGSVPEDPKAMTAMSAMIITKSGANYYIQHANSGYWLCNVNEGSFHGTPDLPFYQDSSAPYAIIPANFKSNVFALKTSTGDNKWLACGGENNTLTVLTEDPTTFNENAGNPAGFWLIKEIKSIPVTIGAAKWSTLCLPVAVKVPVDAASLKVYTVSGVDNVTGVMTLNVVEPGTVVAKNTGLLLASTSENEEDTYNFTVSTEAGTSYNDNKLMGTTARRIGFNTTGATDPTDPAITIPHYV